MKIVTHPPPSFEKKEKNNAHKKKPPPKQSTPTPPASVSTLPFHLTPEPAQAAFSSPSCPPRASAQTPNSDFPHETPQTAP